MVLNSQDYLKGRGAQLKTDNRFLEQSYVLEHHEGLDEVWLAPEKTKVIFTNPKTIVNKVESPDVGMAFSVNPYQGCEHGCVYCYARNSHNYWGYDAGLDFESKIVVKRNAPLLLRQAFENKNWIPEVISLSGNTDCYQPLEKKFKLTRQLLEVCLEYKNPVGILTKNALVLRDLDLLCELAKHRLLTVAITITALDEELRLKMEPRTATYKSRLKVLEKLSQHNIPCGIMAGPVIPGLNASEGPEVIKAAAARGALFAGYTIIRLNGAIKDIFHDWLKKNYPDRYNKVWHQVQSLHNGSVSDSRFGLRMTGEGPVAEGIHQLMRAAKNKYLPKEKLMLKLDTTQFNRPQLGQLSMF